MVYPPEDGHPSRYQPGPMCINFVHAMNAANHYATPPTHKPDAGAKPNVTPPGCATRHRHPATPISSVASANQSTMAKSLYLRNQKLIFQTSLNEYFIYQCRHNTVKTVNSRTVSTGQKGSKSTCNYPNTTALTRVTRKHQAHDGDLLQLS